MAVIDNESKPATRQILEAETGRLVRKFSLRATPHFVVWSPDGTSIATVGESQNDVWDVATGIHRVTLDGRSYGGEQVAFHPAGTLLATNGREGRLRLFDPVLGRSWLDLSGGSDPEFSHDGRTVISVERKLTTYQVDPALEYRTLAHASRVSMNYARPSVRHDGRLLAVGTDRGAVFWDLAHRTRCGKSVTI